MFKKTPMPKSVNVSPRKKFRTLLKLRPDTSIDFKKEDNNYMMLFGDTERANI
jgi:hypothetical protein